MVEELGLNEKEENIGNLESHQDFTSHESIRRYYLE